MFVLKCRKMINVLGGQRGTGLKWFQTCPLWPSKYSNNKIKIVLEQGYSKLIIFVNRKFIYVHNKKRKYGKEGFICQI